MSAYTRKNSRRQFRRQVARHNAVLAGRTDRQINEQRNAIARVAAATHRVD